MSKPYALAEWKKKPWSGIPVCEHCGSVLSPVTWECVRGEHCPGPAKAAKTSGGARHFPHKTKGIPTFRR